MSQGTLTACACAPSSFGSCSETTGSVARLTNSGFDVPAGVPSVYSKPLRDAPVDRT